MGAFAERSRDALHTGAEIRRMRQITWSLMESARDLLSHFKTRIRASNCNQAGRIAAPKLADGALAARERADDRLLAGHGQLWRHRMVLSQPAFSCCLTFRDRGATGFCHK